MFSGEGVKRLTGQFGNENDSLVNKLTKIILMGDAS